jgi:hypothetical protein
MKIYHLKMTVSTVASHHLDNDITLPMKWRILSARFKKPAKRPLDHSSIREESAGTLRVSPFYSRTIAVKEAKGKKWWRTPEIRVVIEKAGRKKALVAEK